jgi:hypothetical protein
MMNCFNIIGCITVLKHVNKNKEIKKSCSKDIIIIKAVKSHKILNYYSVEYNYEIKSSLIIIFSQI